MTRCLNKRNGAYPAYGGRGIKICERWLIFENFVADMGEPPDDLTLDRIDNDGNYEPGNCRWASRTEQARNRRSNRFLTVDGATLTVAEWSERSGVEQHTICARLKRGLSVEEALRPLRKKDNNR